MKKLISISLLCCISLIFTNSFGMFMQKLTNQISKKNICKTYRSCHINPSNQILTKEEFEGLKELVKNRYNLKRRNDLLRANITAQNRILKKLEIFDNQPGILKFLYGDKITILAQQLQILEKEIRK